MELLKVDRETVDALSIKVLGQISVSSAVNKMLLVPSGLRSSAEGSQVSGGIAALLRRSHLWRKDDRHSVGVYPQGMHRPVPVTWPLRWQV